MESSQNLDYLEEEAGGKTQCKVINAPDLVGDSPWGEPRGGKSTAEVSALRQFFAFVDGQRQRQQTDKPSSISASCMPSPAISAPSRSVAKLPTEGELTSCLFRFGAPSLGGLRFFRDKS